jgi:hypothetical protein
MIEAFFAQADFAEAEISLAARSARSSMIAV